MHIVSVNVGRPREVVAGRETIATGIWKTPVDGDVRVRTLNLDGDAQADLTVHGGRNKAVYAYPSEHYEYWRNQLPDAALPWGVFGENLTLDGVRESDVRVGDEIAIGTAVLVVTQPRIPCYKLAVRFNRPDMVKRFLRSRRTGFYSSVAKEGSLRAGDDVQLRPVSRPSLTIAELVALFTGDSDDESLLRIGATLAGLPKFWREMCVERLNGDASEDNEEG